jgi:hypothetical protein
VFRYFALVVGSGLSVVIVRSFVCSVTLHWLWAPVCLWSLFGPSCVPLLCIGCELRFVCGHCSVLRVFRYFALVAGSGLSVVIVRSFVCSVTVHWLWAPVCFRRTDQTENAAWFCFMADDMEVCLVLPP